MVVKRWIVGLGAVLALGAGLAEGASTRGPEPTKTALIDMGPGCRIRLQVPQKAGYGGIPPDGGFPGRGGITIENPLNLKRKTYIEPLYLRFFCHDADPEALSEGDPLSYDASTHTWRKDMEKLYGLYVDPDRAFKKKLDQAVRIYEMKSVNAQGFAYTLDDVTGEESTRRRVLHYCLFRDKKAVCSGWDTRMGYLPEIRRHPARDLTPYALRILRSIEFVDEAPQAAPTASQPASQ
ncbi:MAG: hypothetical protein KatS3mg122_3232 [Caldimonas sp.]|nr:MAG: hypothetical protein KatS3mg122_1651 [Caldimonas sp.]GIX26001.1 MAG: hypothetical protein KatS3mg122_3232 [Caldimonas sp.]